MRPLLLTTLFLVGCAAEGQAVKTVHSSSAPKEDLTGPRELSIGDGSDEDVLALATSLKARGFEVVRPVGGVLPRLTKYVAAIEGLCGSRVGNVEPTLRVAIYALDDRRLVFESKALDTGACPQPVFEEAAKKLADFWAKN
jgi:hypothetical protein